MLARNHKFRTLLTCLAWVFAVITCGDLNARSNARVGTQAQSTITTPHVGVSINGIEISAGSSVLVEAGTVQIEFNGESRLSETVISPTKKDHQNIKTIACVALLPLCPAIMSINTDGNSKVVTKAVHCSGSKSVDLDAGRSYLVEILEDEYTYPTLQISQTETTEYWSTKKALVCRPPDQPVSENSPDR